jgi:hypothetical protein
VISLAASRPFISGIQLPQRPLQPLLFPLHRALFGRRLPRLHRRQPCLTLHLFAQRFHVSLRFHQQLLQTLGAAGNRGTRCHRSRAAGVSLADLLQGPTGGAILTLLYGHADQPFYTCQIAREVRDRATRKTLITSSLGDLGRRFCDFTRRANDGTTIIRYVPHDKMRRHASAEFQM